LGALAGYNGGLLRNDSVTGQVEGSAGDISYDTVGGLAGLSYSVIVGSHADVKVVNGTFSGGLVGTLRSFGDAPQVLNSYATGSVNNEAVAGGLVGISGDPKAVIADSFATGDVDTSGAPDYISTGVGGLVGDNYGSVLRSFATGNLVGGGGGTNEGGLVGNNPGAIADSYSSATVNGAACSGCGGLVGENSFGTVSTSYSIAKLNVSQGAFGGFIGFDNSNPGTLSADYWDFETSGVTDPAQGAGYPSNDAGITGLTDAQLKATLPSGFDPQVWAQNPNINNGYPYLLANRPPNGDMKKKTARRKRA
jgi:hypothetical protein